MKENFPVLRAYQDLVYLDNANTTHKPESVLRGVDAFYDSDYATTGRGVYNLSIEAEKKLVQSKKNIASWIGASSHLEIVSTYSATYASNLLAHSLFSNGKLKSGDTVILSESEHHANIVPWLQLSQLHGVDVQFVRLDTELRIDLDHLEELLHDRVRVVALQHISNVSGAIHSLEEVRSVIGRDRIFVVDAAQSVLSGHLDVSELDCDFAFFSGHKMFASMGIGILYGKQSYLRDLNPAFGGGGSINFVSQSDFSYAGLPERWEPGIQNIGGILSVSLAIDFIQKHKHVFADYQKDMMEYVRARYQDVSGGGLVLLGHHDSRNVPVFSFAYNNGHVNDLADYLADKNICVRSGHHCCEPLHSSLGLTGTLRISLAPYNSKEDIDAFFDAIHDYHAGHMNT